MLYGPILVPADVGPHGCEIERDHAQRAGERSTSFGELEAPRVGMHPGAPTGKGATGVDHSPGLPGVVGHRHHP